MRQKLKKLNSSEFIATVMIIVFILSLIPILYVGRYCRPLFDDFGFSKNVHDIIMNGGNIFDIIKTAVQESVSVYNSWQGTFVAVFIFALQPGIYGNDMYFLTPFIMIFSLIVSVSLLVYTVVVRKYKLKKSYSVILSVMTLFLMIQFVPDKNQAYYWFNGSSYYTLFFAFSLVFISCCLKLYWNLYKNKTEKTFIKIFIVLNAFLISGGNYTTGLVTCELLIIFVVYLWIKKDKNKVFFAAVFVVLTVLFVVNMAAPGNSVRAAACNGINPVKAILKSFICSAEKIGEWTEIPQFVFMIMSLPVMYKISSKSEFSFGYPVIVVGVALCIYASQLTPVLYATNIIGGGRQIDIYYYAYYLLILFCSYYLCGWFNHKYDFNLSVFEKFVKNNALFILMCLSVFGCLQFFVTNICYTTTGATVYSIINGSAEEYCNEYEKITEDIVNGGDNVIVEDIKTVPDFFCNFGITDDAESDYYWLNEVIAEYYDKESVLLKTENIKGE